MTTWMVRARDGELIEQFLQRGVVALGWGEVGDLSKFQSKQELLEELEKHWPDWSDGTRKTSANQLFRFYHEVEPGDRALTYDPQRRIYHIGRIIGPYRFEPQYESAPNAYPVRWEGEVERDALSTSAKNSLGAISTFFMLPEHVASEIESILTGHQHLEGDESTDSDDEAGDETLLREEIEEKALEFIKDRISQLDWEQMQELVAGLLRAMGYKTRVSPSGPDQGKDIIASPDGFGFESPRIIVEVKHRKEAMGSMAIRSFLGGRHKDDKGLYVSTGGFTKDAYYEAERANIPLTLLNLDQLTQALLENYESLDNETKRLLPLKKIYWPI